MPPPVFFYRRRHRRRIKRPIDPMPRPLKGHMNGFLLPQGFCSAIATGVYGFPREAAARVAATTIGSHLEEQQLPEPVIFVCFETATFNAYCNAAGWERENELW